MEYQKIKGVKHFVYENVDEFREHFEARNMEVPALVPSWRDAQEGDWCQADDGGVVQILRRATVQHWFDRKNDYVRTVVGSFVVNNYTFMDTDFTQHPNRYRFSKKTNKETYEWRQNRPYLSKLEKILIAKLRLNMPVREAYQSTFGTDKNWRYNLVHLIKTERFQREMGKNVEEIAESLGISYEYILTKLKELVEDSSSDTVKLQSLKELAEWLRREAQVTETIQMKHLPVGVDDKALANAQSDRLAALEEASRDD